MAHSSCAAVARTTQPINLSLDRPPSACTYFWPCNTPAETHTEFRSQKFYPLGYRWGNSHIQPIKHEIET
ncbi:hypothetical protein F511_06811 [Dorcoceras hygrometricum]|uniref:Uncharacterized protein n=1 Tax=Dorcoceras hygrometricum TaxID=472368 RepID=A0A2Z6ZQU7_9LAMI|nr:hypothetical protein F511_47746 [Dorcoceras hygrometricum]KZV45293.1 hypothetical protein F511_06811 [Dorcoceras hygrometricum]